MRTTLVLDDSLDARLKSLAGKRSLSRFVSQCVREHFEQRDHVRKRREMEAAYQRAARLGGKPSDFDAVDGEGWPEW